MQAGAPATIQLWHFDEAAARWKENGTATKAGSTYTAQVDKFSFWNCDVANANFINLDYTLINATTNSPLVSTNTRIKRVSNGSYGNGLTNNTGFVSGLVPKNEALILEVVSSCNTVIYSQNIGPFTVNTSLGSVSLTLPSSQYITFTGTLLNCSAAPVTNGYISFYSTSGGGTFEIIKTTGVFSFSILNCSGSNISYNVQGTDNTTLQQSLVLSGNALSGNVNLNNINACGIPVGSVYIVGTTGGPVIWKDGIITNLANNGNFGYANSVFVTDTDVYVAGSEHIGTINSQKAKIWKNGIGSYLTNNINESIGKSIYVSGTDVYVAGSDNGEATIWKNGVISYLTNTFGYSTANSVFVFGNDVYVAGHKYDGTNRFATVWKNGVATNLNAGTTNQGSANSVFVSGADVYVAGKIFTGSDFATLWKNGVAINLGNAPSVANSVFVSGNDVYVAGVKGSGSTLASAVLWKNGIETTLALNSYNNTAKSVYVYGIDVYVAGIKDYGGNIPTVWKNGTPTYLTPGYTIETNSVFVK